MWQKKIDERINDVLAAVSMITHDDCMTHQTFEIPQECSDKLYRFDHNTSGLSRINTTRENKRHPHVAANYPSHYWAHQFWSRLKPTVLSVKSVMWMFTGETEAVSYLITLQVDSFLNTYMKYIRFDSAVDFQQSIHTSCVFNIQVTPGLTSNGCTL